MLYSNIRALVYHRPDVLRPIRPLPTTDDSLDPQDWTDYFPEFDYHELGGDYDCTSSPLGLDTTLFDE